MAFKMNKKNFDFGNGTGFNKQNKQGSPMDKPLVGDQHKLPAHLKAKIESAPDSPTKIIPLIMGGLTVADLAYQGYKAYKGHKKKKAAKEEARKAEIKKKVASMTPEQKAKFRENFPFGKKKSASTGAGGGVAGLAKKAVAGAKKMKAIQDAGKKGGKKASGGTRTWAQGQAATGGNLNALVAKRKGLKKGTPEYAAVQNKINAALGSKKRH